MVADGNVRVHDTYSANMFRYVNIHVCPKHTHTHIYTHTHTHTQVQGMMTAEVNLPMLMSLLWMGLLPSGLALALETVIVHKLSRSCVLCVCACVCAVRLYVFLCQRQGVRVCVCVCVYVHQ